MTTEGMKRRIYEIYQLDWISKHGFSMLNILYLMANISLESESMTAEELVSEWFNTGFSGMLFVCFEEFLETEYKDQEYILDLCKRDYNRKELRELYLQEIKKEAF